jgi:hypothetical protein
MKINKPEPIIIPGSENDGRYEYSFPDPNDRDMFPDGVINYGKPIKEQKWKRWRLPESQEEYFLLGREEGLQLNIREICRRKYGIYIMIGGELTYLTGHHYFFLQYWYMAAITEDGYPEFRDNHQYYFYFLDLVEKDPFCFGSIFITQKRFAKTEIGLSCMANIATLGESKNERFLMQGLNGTIARTNLFNRVVRSYNMLPYFSRPVDDGKMNQGKKINMNYPSVNRKNIDRGKKPLGNTIEWANTVPSAMQGTRPRYVFLDEAPTITEMDVSLWHRTTREQLRLGSTIFGKMHLPATVEDMDYKGAATYQDLWKRSNAKERDANGHTSSGLYRYFQPYWMGWEGFYDEFGRARREDIKKYIKNMLDPLPEAEVKQKKRQYPDNIEDVFEIPSGATLEEDVVEILKDQYRALCQKWDTPDIRVEFCKLRVENGEVIKTQYTPKKNDDEDQEKYIRITEDPRPGVRYIIGIDGTATDKETTTVQDGGKSKFAIVATKCYEAGVKDNGEMMRVYCDVGVFSAVPNRMDDMFAITYAMFLYWNKYGNCLVHPEANAALGPNLLSYFENRGAKRHIMRQPKFPGSDNRQTQNRYGTYRSGEVMEEQIRLTNRAARAYGYNLRDKFLVRDLCQVGLPGKDPHLADAFMMAILGWGDFAPDKKHSMTDKKPVRHMRYKQINGIWKQVWE